MHYYILVTNAMKEKIDIKEMINKRKARGMTLIELGIEPKEVNPHTWIVPSSSCFPTSLEMYLS